MVRRLSIACVIAVAAGVVATARAAVVPYHVQLAEQMVATIAPANNSYTNGTPVVTFTGISGATQMYNASDCSSFITKLLQASYKWTNSMFTKWTGESDPEAEDYYAAAMANKGFLHFDNVNSIVPGDLFIMKYINATDTGHMTLITDKPTYLGISTQSDAPGERMYALPILDCTGSPHGSSDSRYATGQDGVGTGFMRIYTDAAGNIEHYSWNNYTNGIIYDPATRLPTFAHLALPEPSAVIGLVPAMVLLRRPRPGSAGR